MQVVAEVAVEMLAVLVALAEGVPVLVKGVLEQRVQVETVAAEAAVVIRAAVLAVLEL